MAEADQCADATPFIEFMLSALRDAIREAVSTDQVSDHVTDQVALLIEAIDIYELGSAELLKVLALSHRPTFRKNHLDPALQGGWIERTQPDSPLSPTQRYRLTHRGWRWLQQRKN